MHITNITDYDKMTDAYNNTLSLNNFCTNNEIIIEIIIPLFTKNPCGMSLMCLKTLMLYTLTKPLIINFK